MPVNEDDPTAVIRGFLWALVLLPLAIVLLIVAPLIVPYTTWPAPDQDALTPPPLGDIS